MDVSLTELNHRKSVSYLSLKKYVLLLLYLNEMPRREKVVFHTFNREFALGGSKRLRKMNTHL